MTSHTGLDFKQRSGFFRGLLCIHLLAIAFPLSSSAQIVLPTYLQVVVGTTSDGANATGCSLRQALATVATDANVGDCQRQRLAGDRPNQILFDAAIVPGQIILTQQLDVTADTAINGPGQEVFQISGVGAHRIFQVSTAELVVRDITLTQGSAMTDGGAILSDGPVTVSNSRIINSRAAPIGGFGGAIAIESSGSLFLESSEISGCSADFGGGGLSLRGPFNISDSIISNNEAQNGGAIFASADGTISGSQIADNNTSLGSSIQVAVANVLVESSTLTAGSGTSEQLISGGADSVLRVSGSHLQDLSGATTGVLILDGPAFVNLELTIENSTITGSRGIAAQNFLALLNSTITVTETPALQFFSGATARGRIANSIVVSDGADDCVTNGAILVENSHNLYTDGDCTDVQENLIFADPTLGPLSDNGGPTLTRVPSPGSPAIDAGNVFCPGTDQRGFARTDSLCDIGAVEVGATDTLFADGFE